MWKIAVAIVVVLVAVALGIVYAAGRGAFGDHEEPGQITQQAGERTGSCFTRPFSLSAAGDGCASGSRRDR